LSGVQPQGLGAKEAEMQIVGKSLCSKAGQRALRSLPLAEYSRHRSEAMQLLYLQLQEQIDEMDKVMSDLARERPQARPLMTHPGVGR
jgi:hypothetical protein